MEKVGIKGRSRRDGGYGGERSEDRPTQAGTGQWTGAGGARRVCARSTREREGGLSPIHHISSLTTYLFLLLFSSDMESSTL